MCDLKAQKGFFQAVQAKREAEDYAERVRWLHRELERLADDGKEWKPRKYTGWFALLASDGSGGWKCIACIDPYDPEADEGRETELLEQAELIMPIPTVESMPEFDGF